MAITTSIVPAANMFDAIASSCATKSELPISIIDAAKSYGLDHALWCLSELPQDWRSKLVELALVFARGAIEFSGNATALEEILSVSERYAKGIASQEDARASTQQAESLYQAALAEVDSERKKKGMVYCFDTAYMLSLKSIIDASKVCHSSEMSSSPSLRRLGPFAERKYGYAFFVEMAARYARMAAGRLAEQRYADVIENDKNVVKDLMAKEHEASLAPYKFSYNSEAFKKAERYAYLAKEKMTDAYKHMASNEAMVRQATKEARISAYNSQIQQFILWVEKHSNGVPSVIVADGVTTGTAFSAKEPTR
ncbi:hypothetical protein ABMY26_07155 (plasmid) [Azospirillum sp. HJ39]|uniref:hypothetical protein n=1 Tax=Azospirillum sp. HJ39 TaxID=3159496 RepID=UPI0035574F15